MKSRKSSNYNDINAEIPGTTRHFQRAPPADFFTGILDFCTGQVAADTRFGTDSTTAVLMASTQRTNAPASSGDFYVGRGGPKMVLGVLGYPTF